MDSVVVFLQKLGEMLGGQIMMVLGLIAAQVILGIAVALKNKVFEWQNLANFFETIVLPKILGWLACAILARFVLPSYLPTSLSAIGPGIELVAFGAVVLALAGAILANLQALEILPAGISNVLTSIGVPSKGVVTVKTVATPVTVTKTTTEVTPGPTQ
jgi:hypothetical protein